MNINVHIPAAYPHITANNVTSHHTPRMTCCTRHWSCLLLGCTLHGRVVDGHIQQYLYGLVVQRSLTVLRHSMIYYVMCGCRIVFAIFSDSGVQDMTCYKCTEEAGSRRDIIDTRRRHQWWFPRRIFVARVYTGRRQRCPVSIDLYIKWYMLRKARKSFFCQPWFGDPPQTKELIAPL